MRKNKDTGYWNKDFKTKLAFNFLILEGKKEKASENTQHANL
jgi:hypothetical protein